jgi:hypothetical protein
MLLRKFGLIVWKNLLLRKRHWIVTSFEIVIPVVLFILIAVIRSQLKSPDVVVNVSANYFPIQEENEVTSYISYFCKNTVLYAPNNSFANCIMGNVTSNGTFFGK